MHCLCIQLRLGREDAQGNNESPSTQSGWLAGGTWDRWCHRNQVLTRTVQGWDQTRDWTTARVARCHRLRNVAVTERSCKGVGLGAGGCVAAERAWQALVAFVLGCGRFLVRCPSALTRHTPSGGVCRNVGSLHMVGSRAAAMDGRVWWECVAVERKKLGAEHATGKRSETGTLSASEQATTACIPNCILFLDANDD